MSQRTAWVSAYAIIRVDYDASSSPDGDDDLGPSNVVVKEIVMSDTDARAEVKRLNHLNADKDCRYFWQGTHLFQGGGSFGAEAKGNDTV